MPAEAVVERLFFVLWPDDVSRTALEGAVGQLRQRLHPTGRWVRAQRYHLTLHFLGEYPVLPPALVQRALEAAASVRAAPFVLCIDQAGGFRNPRSIPWWLGPRHTPPELKTLWRALREALQAQSVPYDTRLRLTPHVTVLYDAAQVLAPTPLPEVRWEVDRFALIRSRLGADAGYTVLGSWPLRRPTDRAVIQRDLWDT